MKKEKIFLEKGKFPLSFYGFQLGCPKGWGRSADSLKKPLK